MRIKSLARAGAVAALLGGALIGTAATASASGTIAWYGAPGCRSWYGPDATGASLAPCDGYENYGAVTLGAAQFKGNADDVVLWLGTVNSNGSVSEISGDYWSFGQCHGTCGWWIPKPYLNSYYLPGLTNMVFVEQYELGGVWHDFIESPEFSVAYEA